MKIGIVGGGSIGLLFGAYLSHNNDVVIYTRSNTQANKLSEKGITIKKGTKIIKSASIKAVPFNDWVNDDHLTIITVKQYDIQHVINKIAEKKSNPNSCLLFLQNGMGHISLLDQLKNWNILLGSVEHGALRINSNTVCHTGNGLTRIAKYNSNDAILDKIINSVNSNFPFLKEDDYEEMLLQKLIVNIMINPLTAILNVNNGSLIENSNFYRVFKLLFAEVNEIFEFQNKQKVFAHVVDVCNKTANNKSSMLKDVTEGRQTEVDAILGYAIMIAKKKQLKTPLIEMLYFLIKGKEIKGEVL